MNKVKKIFYNNKFSFLSFATVVVILCCVYICNNIAPFGTTTPMLSDSFHQYLPLLTQLHDKIANGESLIYSLSTGLGSPAIGNFFNYLSSPLSWIIVLFGKNNVPALFGISIILKAALSAFTCSIFLKCKSKINNLSLCIFSVSYALSYFFGAYFWNIMWMDVMYTLPVVFLGIHLLLNKNNIILYPIALSYTIITNYYMGFMVCIASVIYFVYEYFTTYSIKELNITHNNIFKKSIFLNKFSLFAILSIVAAGISCISLLPMYEILGFTSATNNPLPNNIEFSSIIPIISNHFYCNVTSFDTVNQQYILPNVYCGILTLLCTPFFFFSKEITKKEKIMAGITILFFFLSFSINYLNLIWHVGHFPNSLPYRFSYIYILFLIYFAFIGFTKIKTLTKRQLLCTLGVWLLTTIVCCAISSPYRSNVTIIGTLLLFVVYTILIVSKKCIKYRNILIFTLIICELFVPYLSIMYSYDKDMLYENSSDVEYMKSLVNNEDEFYRAEILSYQGSMPSAVYKFNGLSSFSSISYENVSKFHIQTGVNSNGLNSAHYQPQSPIYNMIMSMDYIIDNDSNFNVSKNEFEKIGTNPDTKSDIYKSNYPTSIAFGSVTDLSQNLDISSLSPFEVQNRLANLISNTTIRPLKHIENTIITADGIDIEVKNTQKGYEVKYKLLEDAKDPKITITTTAPFDNCYYLTVQNVNKKFKQTVSCNGRELKKALDVYPGSICVGDVNKHETYTTTLLPLSSCPSEGVLQYYTCYYKETEINDFYHSLKENGIAKVLDFKEDYVQFEIDNTTNYIFTSIPYDKNWEVKIDDKIIPITNIKTTADAFCFLEVSPGKHIIEFTYKPKSLLIGMTISAISLSFFILILILKKQKDKKTNEKRVEKVYE